MIARSDAFLSRLTSHIRRRGGPGLKFGRAAPLPVGDHPAACSPGPLHKGGLRHEVREGEVRETQIASPRICGGFT